MKKFVFELQDVLKFREFEQQQAEVELGKALSAEKEIQDKLDLLASQKVSMEREMKGCTDFNAIVSANRFSEFVRTQSEFLLEELAQAKLISDQKRDVLKGCMQKVNALEKLKEKQQADWKEQTDYEENESTDDIVTANYGRKK